MRTAIAFMAVLLAAAGTQAEDVRYTDEVNGFSLIPPIGSIQTKVDEASKLAQWIKVDPNTSNTEWAFSVSRQVAEVRNAKGKKLIAPEYTELKISQFMDSILADVQGQPGVKVLSKTEQTICNHEAIVVECTGSLDAKTTDVENQRWMKEAWVRVTPRMFLVFKIVGREKFKKRAQLVWKAFMDTLTISDDNADTARQQEQEKAINAEKILDTIAKEKLQGIFVAQPQWFLLSQDKTVVGWLCMGSRPKVFLDAKGYDLRSYAEIRIAKQPVKLVYQQMFVSEDLKIEQWRLWMQSGDGDQAQLMAEDGLMQSNHVVCETNYTGQPASKLVMDLPELATNMYLPKAVGTLIASRLVGTTDTGYIFAEYDSGRNNLAMRELTVTSPEELSTDTGPVKAVKIIETNDRSNTPTNYWVSADGKMLKIQNSAGMVMTATSREVVLKKFPSAPSMIEAIRDASQKKWKEGN